MTLGTRARLAWIPLILWCAAALAIAGLKAASWQGNDPVDGVILILGGAFLAAAGGLQLWRLARRWGERARAEGPQVDLPITWHRKSGSWAVILFVAGVFGTFGLVYLMGLQVR
jgi:uncharacterized membrane protein YidH (DUF202 family)